MKIFKYIFMIFVISSGCFGEIFRTAVSPGRVFIDSKGGNGQFTVENLSDKTIKIQIDTGENTQEDIKFFPKNFQLRAKKIQVIRVQVKKTFFCKNENIIFVTEMEPLKEINGVKIRPQHGVTIKALDK